MTVTDEDVDEMVAMFKLAGVKIHGMSNDEVRKWVREKLEQGKVPCFESRKWVKREKNDEVV